MDPPTSIAAIDAEIAKIDEQIHHLSLQRRALNAVRNSLLPISILPPDILIQVFDMLRRTGPSQARSLLVLTWVSRYWRDIALGCEGLWTIIDDSLKTQNSQGILQWLERSRNAPLSIRFVDLKDNFGTCLIFSHLHRFQKVMLRGPTPHLATRPLWNGPVPLLQSLTIWSLEIPELLYSTENASMQELVLASCRNLNWDKLIAVFPGLKRLCARTKSGEHAIAPGIPVDRFIGYVNMLPNLRSISLDNILRPAEREGVSYIPASGNTITTVVLREDPRKAHQLLILLDGLGRISSETTFWFRVVLTRYNPMDVTAFLSSLYSSLPTAPSGPARTITALKVECLGFISLFRHCTTYHIIDQAPGTPDRLIRIDIESSGGRWNLDLSTAANFNIHSAFHRSLPLSGLRDLHLVVHKGNYYPMQRVMRYFAYEFANLPHVENLITFPTFFPDVCLAPPLTLQCPRPFPALKAYSMYDDEDPVLLQRIFDGLARRWQWGCAVQNLILRNGGTTPWSDTSISFLDNLVGEVQVIDQTYTDEMLWDRVEIERPWNEF